MTVSPDNNNVSRIRIRILLIIFAVWAVCACGMLVYYACIRSDELKRQSRLLAWRIGTLPPVRGKIITSDGTILAWTEMVFDLVIDPPHLDSKYNFRAYKPLQDTLGDELFNPSTSDTPSFPLTAVRDVPYDKLKSLMTLGERYPEITLKPRFERMYVDYADLREISGLCERDSEGLHIGISGLEKEYDSSLRGTPGEFKVMLDASGRWFTGTLEILTPSIPGNDIILEKSLAELRKGGTENGK